MGTNKDQAQAQAFMLRRVVSALTVGEADPEQPPFRRPLLAAVGGIVIGVLAMAAFWVYGLLVPGGDRFTATDVIAVEKETGTRFVLLDGRLHRVVNYTSALLALDRHAEVRVVSRATLAGIPVGPPIGIEDAPDPLPDPGALLTGAWSSCHQSTVEEEDRRDTTVLLVGQEPGGGVALGRRALLVHAGGRVYVVHNGYRHEVARDVDVALELGRESAVTADGTWLDTVPLGRPIEPVGVADAGRPSAAVPGADLLTGQLVEVDSGVSAAPLAKQYYLVVGDQLQQVSPLQAQVQRVLGPHLEPRVMSDRELLGATRSPPVRRGDGDVPWTRPDFLVVPDANATVCARFPPSGTVPGIVVGAHLPALVPNAGGSVQVAVPPRRAALVEVMSGPDAPAGGGTVALVTDEGRLYPLDDPGHVLGVLGLDGVTPVRVTEVLAGRVPAAERSLSPAAARTPVAPG